TAGVKGSNRGTSTPSERFLHLGLSQCCTVGSALGQNYYGGLRSRILRFSIQNCISGHLASKMSRTFHETLGSPNVAESVIHEQANTYPRSGSQTNANSQQHISRTSSNNRSKTL